MDVLLSCFTQPFEGRGTPWAWDLEGERALASPKAVAAISTSARSRVHDMRPARAHKECRRADIAEQIQLTHTVMEHWESILPGRILRVPYEELVTNQETISKRMLAHCGLRWDPAVLNFHDTARAVQTASLSQVCGTACSGSHNSGVLLALHCSGR